MKKACEFLVNPILLKCLQQIKQKVIPGLRLHRILRRDYNLRVNGAAGSMLESPILIYDESAGWQGRVGKNAR